MFRTGNVSRPLHDPSPAHKETEIDRSRRTAHGGLHTTPSPAFRSRALFFFMYTPKRKREDVESCQKKVKNASEREKQAYSTSEEWPVYSHPEGGIVKITPWGSLRQFQDQNGNTVTKFEDKGFQDYAFAYGNASGNGQNNVYELPTTPQSMYRSSPAPTSVSNGDKIDFSPLDEAESYVREGYGSDEWQRYGQEQENYFGMQDNDAME